jgi:hypothetical protein
MGTLSGDGYYQDLDEDRYLDSWEFTRDEDQRQGIFKPDSYYQRTHNTITVPIATRTEKDDMVARYHLNKAAKVGETIHCACCGKAHVKTNYQQAFCPPTGKGSGKRYRCKDKYHNLTNPERAARANIWGA